MPIHSAAAWLSTGSSLTGYAYAGLALVGALALKRWASGRRNTWERDWAGKMVLVVAPPNALTLELLHHLAHLPHPPQILYLPPLPSPLPQPLLTLLHAIRLSASTSAPSSSSDAPAVAQRSVELHCEPLPPTPDAIRRFVKQWAAPIPGTGESGRRIDAVVWADGWEVERALRWFRPARASGVRRATAAQEGEGKSPGSKVRFDVPSNGAEPEPPAKTAWSSPAEARFHLLSAMLPYLLQAPMERSIRLINVVAPFYSAAIPALGRAGVEPDSAAGQKPGEPLLRVHRADAALLASGKTALRDVLFFKHLQRVLDALASAAQAGKIVPPAEGEVVGVGELPEDVEEAASTMVGPRRRSMAQAGANASSAPAPAPKTISVQSNIMALSVVLGLDREGIVVPLLGWTSQGPISWLSLIVYTLLFPLIWLFTPSLSSSIQSVLAALSAPVRYADEDRTAEKRDAARKPSAADDRPLAQAAVRGGDVVRNCHVVHLPIREESINVFGQQVWEELETTVEAGVKECMAREAVAKEAAASGPPSTAEPEEDEQEGSEDGEVAEDWERLEVNEVMSDD